MPLGLQDKRDDRSRPAAILLPSLTEMTSQDCLFLTCLQIVNSNGNHKTDHASDAVEEQDNADEGKQHSAVDGVPHEAIRSGLNQVMRLFQRDGGAPVTTERHACPDGEQDAGPGENNRNHEQRLGTREEKICQTAPWHESEQHSDQGPRNADNQRGTAFCALRCLQAARGS
jgi:hypothetical protein